MEIRFITPQILPSCPGNVIDNVVISQLLGSDGIMEHCCEGCERHCTLAIYFSLKSHFLLRCFMVIVCKSPSCDMYMCTLMHAHTYVSTKWLLEVRSDYVCCKVHWLLLHWYC